jgi:hypothetical protein
VFVNNGEIGGSTTEDSAIDTEGSSSSASMSSTSSFSECLDVIDPRTLAESERLVIEGEALYLFPFNLLFHGKRRLVESEIAARTQNGKAE